MPPKRKQENNYQLVVEGKDDMHAVIHLMSAYIAWPQDTPPVNIQNAEGRENVFLPGYLKALLQSPSIRTLGILLDAEDENPAYTYDRIRHLCASLFSGLPNKLPAQGLIADNPEGQRLGLWVMPDNLSPGSLETFLRHLVPDDAEPVWRHAIESVLSARKMGASCKQHHIEKANLYTWLAWQDEPGYPPGTALKRKILDPRSQSARSFVTWFRMLYDLQETTTEP
jgi:hypothetical protein